MRALILTLALIAASGIAWFAWAPAAAEAAPVKLCVAGMQIHIGQRQTPVRVAMSEALACGAEKRRMISVSVGAAAENVKLVGAPI